MKLGTLLEGVSVSKLFQTMFGQMVTTHDVEVGHLHYDSRKIGRGDAFVAISGSTTDGHAFIQQALAQGAKVVVIERDDAISDPQCMHTGVVKIVVSSTRKALARMAANFYGRPADTMKIVGITGTNGKTTTTHIVRSILEAGGERAGLIGTIENRFGAIVEEATHTTPESLELHALFARMRQERCTAISMEVSSHALDQSRVAGIAFACGVFTNLTQDHLDYHGTMEKYFAAKKALFEGLSPGAKAVINVDDQWGRHLAQDTKVHAVTYGAAPDSTVRLLDASLSVDGSILKIDVGGMTTTVTTPLPGRFNVSNVLAGYATGIALGIPVPAIDLGIAAADRVRGRFERVRSARGWTAIVDYAHTPDALEKCLSAIKDVLPKEQRGKIITVFGAGGDRDRTKRPKMGEVVSRMSDVTIVTSDNPRNEEPDKIIEDIVAGIHAEAVAHREPDRKKAIAMAASMARPGDVILVAGKGHEDYQVIGREKRHFSDREEVEAVA